MKNFLSAVIVFCVMIFSANCQADSITKMNPMIGTWYDVNGNPALTIGSDYTINGCTILEVIECGGYENQTEYKVKIFENNGFRTLQLRHNKHFPAQNFSEEDFHESIVIDEKNIYRKAKHQKHYESIGGIYLGMTKNQVLKLYGEPDRTENENSAFHYEPEGMVIIFDCGIVSAITIYDYGDRKFDRTGLSARDSVETYKKIYKPKADISAVNPAFYIGHGEVIGFSRPGDEKTRVTLE